MLNEIYKSNVSGSTTALYIYINLENDSPVSVGMREE